MWGRASFCQPCSHPKGLRSRPQHVLGPSTCAPTAHGMRNSNQIFRGDQSRSDENFTGSTVQKVFWHERWRAICLRDSLHRLRSYCWETARRSIMPNFSVNPVGKTMRWIKKWMTPFLMVSTTLSPCKVWGRS